jgi:undecaprenyl-diphosphatase
MDILQTIILAIVEGVTEFLPVSSTGHMILASSIMKIHDQAFVKTFEIAIQIGAILAIVMLYYKRFIRGVAIYIKLAIAFLPTAIVGFLAYKTIKTYLFNPLGVSLALIIGGVILILIDKWVVTRETRYTELEEISCKNAFFIGLAQCVSMIPGVSRAAATIIGGVANGLNKKQATEFSFLLAVPTMCAATGYDLLKTDASFSSREYLLLAIGFAGAFLSAWLAVKVFIRFVENHGFKAFGYYRIAVGIFFILYMVLSGSSSLLEHL